MPPTAALFEVVTVKEAARMWGKNRASVVRAIDSRHRPLVARKSDSAWLITVASLRRRWGEPIEPLNTEDLQTAN